MPASAPPLGMATAHAALPRQRGIALIMVLWLTVMLTVASLHGPNRTASRVGRRSLARRRALRA